MSEAFRASTYQPALQAARAEFAAGSPGVMAYLAGCELEERPSRRVIRIPLLGNPLTVSHPDGSVVQAANVTQGAPEVSALVAVVVLHYLSRSVGALDLSDPVRFSGLKDASPYAAAFRRRSELPLAQRFGNNGEAFVRAVTHIGACRIAREKHEPDLGPNPEDVWEVRLLPHLPLGVRLGLSVEGLPADFVILYPRRAGVAYPAEDMAVAGGMLASLLLETAATEKEYGA